MQIPKIPLNHPLLLTLAVTLVAVLVSVVVTEVAMAASGVPMLPVARYLSIGLPATVAPASLYPLFLINSRQRLMRVELERLLRTDVLTELPNRRAFFEFARPLLAQADAPLTAMMIDVDHFKPINDTYGHDAGDAVLKKIAAVIRDTVAAAGANAWTVARIGGEEFAVLVEGLVPTAAGRLAERICIQVHRMVGTGENQEPVTVSVGVAIRTPAMGIDRLLKIADDAVYAAKRDGRDRWSFASADRPVVRTPGARSIPEPANDRIAAG